MRILTVVNWLNRGGIELQLLNAIPWLRQSGVEMDICCVAPGVLDGDFVSQGCAIHQIRKTADCFATARSVRRILAAAPYAAVHSNLGYVSGGIAMGAAQMGVPVAVSIHSAAPLSLFNWRHKPVLKHVRAMWLRWHRHLMDKYVRVFLGHSEANIRAFSDRWQTHPARYRILKNGVKFPATLPARSAARGTLGLHGDVLALLHVGTFREEKNHAGLLQILRGIVSRRPNTVLLLVGDGPLRSAIAYQAQQMDLGRHVRFEGIQDDVWPYYAAADVFVFPSVVEGFGNVLVEGQAAGLPIVASDIPAHHESVAPAQRRFLFPLGRYDVAVQMVLSQAEAAVGGKNPWVSTSSDHVRTAFGIQRFATELKDVYLELTRN